MKERPISIESSNKSPQQGVKQEGEKEDTGREQRLPNPNAQEKKNLPWWLRVLLGGGLICFGVGYGLMPVDALPDPLLLDDAAVFLACACLAWEVVVKGRVSGDTIKKVTEFFRRR